MFLNDMVSIMLKVSSELSRERPKLHVTKRKDALGASEVYEWESSNNLKAEKTGNGEYLSLRYYLPALGTYLIWLFWAIIYLQAFYGCSICETMQLVPVIDGCSLLSGVEL